LSRIIPNQSTFRIDSYFCYVKARSIFHQMNLNPVQAEVTKIQPTFKISEIKGTLAGFRLPDYSKVINVPGYLRKFYLKITSLVGTYCIAKLNLDSYQ